MKKLNLELKADAVPDADAKPKEGREDELVRNLYRNWTVMQQNVNAVYDSALDKRVANPRPGVKQILEKKSGLFRMNLMGKCFGMEVG